MTLEDLFTTNYTSNMKDDLEWRRTKIKDEYKSNPKFVSMYLSCTEKHSKSFKPQLKMNIIKVGSESIQIHKEFDYCIDDLRRLYPNQTKELLLKDNHRELAILDKALNVFDEFFQSATYEGFRVKSCKKYVNEKRPKGYFFVTKSYMDTRWTEALCHKYENLVEHFENEKSP